jgi:hypothetical protein
MTHQPSPSLDPQPSRTEDVCDAGADLPLQPAALPAPDASGSPDFDFLHGRWQVHNRRRRVWLAGCDEWFDFAATAECVPLAGGLGNRDEMRTDHWPGFVGLTLRLFDPRTATWAIHWVDNRHHVLDPPLRGRFTGGLGFFTGRDSYRGQPVTVRFHWRGGVSPRWEQAFSIDGGASWEMNWTMDFHRLSP